MREGSPACKETTASSLYGPWNGSLYLRLTCSSVPGWWLLLVQGHRSRSAIPVCGAPGGKCWWVGGGAAGRRAAAGVGAFSAVGSVVGLLLFVLSARLPLGHCVRPTVLLLFKDWLCTRAPTPLSFLLLQFPQEALLLRGYQGPFSLKHHGNVLPGAASGPPAGSVCSERSDAAMLAPGCANGRAESVWLVALRQCLCLPFG